MPFGTSLTYTVESRKFKVLGTRDFNSKYRFFELKGCRLKTINTLSGFSPIKRVLCVFIYP